MSDLSASILFFCSLRLIWKVIRNIDPRFFKVAAMDVPTQEERRKPFLYRYFVKIPEAGKFMFLDSGWMDEVTGACLDGTLNEKDYKKKIESFRRFERQLTDNGYLVFSGLCGLFQFSSIRRPPSLNGNPIEQGNDLLHYSPRATVQLNSSARSFSASR